MSLTLPNARVEHCSARNNDAKFLRFAAIGVVVVFGGVLAGGNRIKVLKFKRLN